MDVLLPYGSLFVSSFLSATILPMASEGVLGVMIYNAYPPLACLLVATTGNVLGGVTNYIIGQLGNWRILEKYFGVTEKKIKRWKTYADRYGAYLGLLGWVPIIGDPLIIALGFFRVSFWRVFFWMTLGKFLRYAVIVLSMVYLQS